MSILMIILVGGLIGWIAARLAGRDEGILGSILIGIVGSFIGSILSKLLTGSDRSYLAFDWGAFFWSLIGALILVAILNRVSHPRHHPTV